MTFQQAFEKARTPLVWFFGNLTVLGTMIFILNLFSVFYTGSLIGRESLFVFSLIFASLWLLFYIKKDESHYNNILEPYFKYFFIVLLLIITVGSLQFNFLTNLSWFSYFAGSVKNYQFYLILIAIVCGFFTFYFNRKEVEAKEENEKLTEQQLEDKRKADFAHKFPRINKIWGVRSIVKWMYKEGWSFSIPFVMITLLFIAIKIGMPLIYNGSYIDEWNHILSGIELFKTGHFAEIYPGENYSRGSIISFLEGLFLSLFGKSIFVAKMVPAIIGVFNFVLLYNLARKFIYKKFYLLTLMVMYTLSPLIIFSHFYIKISVLYEFVILIILTLFLRILNYKSKLNRVLLISLLIVLIDIILYFLLQDLGIYMII
ncbi:MAG: hypothetical protein WCK90_04575, partial [archaeon]